METWQLWGFPKIRGTSLRVPMIRIVVFWGLYWSTHNFGKLPYGKSRDLLLRVLGV